MSTGGSPHELPEENGAAPETYVFLEKGSWKTPNDEKLFNGFLKRLTDQEDPENVLEDDNSMLKIGRQEERTNEYEYVGMTDDIDGLLSEFERMAEVHGYEQEELRIAYT
ncbi:MAG: hypothetical protein MUP63_04080 [Candidatus Nanohaloarchaeota archaeon QJJ-7]|nr:hypothetical protein [Candidatus Nanohaloarchaeota archaeon QJJ-7]